MKSKLIIILLILAVLCLGCIGTPPEEEEEEPVCAQVITYASNDETEECVEYPTACIPDGWTVVDKCPEEEVDLCEGISCDSKCMGTTWHSDGSCSEGTCSYATTEENSKTCGYVAPGLDLVVENKFCVYEAVAAGRQLRMFYSIKNNDSEATAKDASIWIIGDEITSKKFRILNKSYPQNQILWGDKQWGGAYDWQGEEWTIKGFDSFPDFDYKLVYCEDLDVYSENCSEDNGQVLYSGNTITDCNNTAG